MRLLEEDEKLVRAVTLPHCYSHEFSVDRLIFFSPLFTSDCTKNKVKHQCGHTFCTNCVTKSQEPNFRCMICRSPIF